MVKSQGLAYEEYTVKDGLPSMQTYNIVQDSLGILWIGTENGLVSYDGDKFVRYTHPDLIDNDIIKVVQRSDGRIFILNISGQLGYLNNNKIELIDTADIPVKLLNILIWNDKIFLIGPSYMNDESYELVEKSNQSFEIIPSDKSLFNHDEKIAFIKIDNLKWRSNRDSSILTRDKKLYKFNLDKKEYYLRNKNHRLELVELDQALKIHFEDNFYRRFIKHENDVFIFNDNETTFFDSKSKTISPFLSNIKVNTIFIDLENNAWCSTYNKGLLKISNPLFKLKQKKINVYNGISDISQDKNGNIYLGTSTSDIIVNPLRDVKIMKTSTTQRPIQIIDNDNQIIGFNENSILTIDCNTLEYKIGPILVRAHKAVLISNDTIYIGSGHGLLIKKYESYKKNGIYKFDKSFLKGIRIQNLHQQKETNQILVGTNSGLAISKKDSFDFVNNTKLRSANISSIIDGKDKSIWVGTKTEGIYNFRNDSILYHYNNTNGLISNNINNLEINKSELIISAASGLMIIDLSNNTSKVVNENNFLTSNKVNVCKVINGEYWIGTDDGLTILTKEEINKSTTTRPILSLKNLYVNGIEKEYLPGMELAYNSNNIQLNLQNISYNSGSDKKIKYRIPLIDSTWIFTTDPNLRLPSLKPGKYLIEASGINAVGIESKPLKLFFTLKRAWWETIWARMLGILTLLSVSIFIIRFKTNQEKQKRDYLTQINKIKDQALQLQMNPHFIFNSLNAIQGFIGTDEEEMAMNYLARFARLIRLIFEHSKGNTITLEEELEFIKLYLALEKLRFKDKVNVQMIIDQEIESVKDIINVPPLLIQPIIENSFKHGLFHKKGKGNLKIEYTLLDKVLKVIIEDDGIGRLESKKIAQINTEKQTSSGIKTTIERIDLLNFGKKKILNSVEIIDLYDDQGNAIGTKTILKLEISS